MKYEITVIVPIYNTEKFLNEALKSLVNQTIFSKMEIILVNDGSTDNSIEICKKFYKEYDNIKFFNQQNLGVSAARNTGLINATGKYVTFMDSDDIVEKDLYERELNAIKSKDYDLLIIDFEKKHANGINKKYRKRYQKEWNNYKEALIDFFNGTIGNQVVDKLFLLEKVKNIKFPTEYKIGEDMSFTYNAIINSEKIYMDTNISGYTYVLRESSAMTGEFSKKYFDPIKIAQNMCDDCKKDIILYEYAKSHFIHESCKALEYVYRHNSQSDYLVEINKIKNEIKKYKIIDAYHHLVKKQFLGFILMRISIKIYLFFHKVMSVG